MHQKAHKIIVFFFLFHIEGHIKFGQYSKSWVSDHLTWATTLPWATIFSNMDAILHFTLSPATTLQTRPVTYLDLFIYLLKATRMMLQNAKLTVKFTKDVTCTCIWHFTAVGLGCLLFMPRSQLTGTTGCQIPCGLLNIAHLIALAALNMFFHAFQGARFALFNRYRMWQMIAVNQPFFPYHRHAGKPCYTKEC